MVRIFYDGRFGECVLRRLAWSNRIRVPQDLAVIAFYK